MKPVSRNERGRITKDKSLKKIFFTKILFFKKPAATKCPFSHACTQISKIKLFGFNDNYNKQLGIASVQRVP